MFLLLHYPTMARRGRLLSLFLVVVAALVLLSASTVLVVEAKEAVVDEAPSYSKPVAVDGDHHRYHRKVQEKEVKQKRQNRVDDGGAAVTVPAKPNLLWIVTGNIF